MGSFSIVHWLILLAVVLLFFGAGRLPNVMGDFAKGIKAFRAGMREDEPVKPAPGVIPQAAAGAPIPNPTPSATQSDPK
jgi:sec-independent protein translocase protein TatA